MTTPKKKPAKIGRPKLPKGEARVTLVAQRVTPETLRILEQFGRGAGGIGRAIDAAAEALKILHGHLNARSPRPARRVGETPPAS